MLVIKTNLGNNTIISYFYRGSKDVIKDEIARREARLVTV
jgi:hypothetical protein